MSTREEGKKINLFRQPSGGHLALINAHANNFQGGESREKNDPFNRLIFSGRHPCTNSESPGRLCVHVVPANPHITADAPKRVFQPCPGKPAHHKSFFLLSELAAQTHRQKGLGPPRPPLVTHMNQAAWAPLLWTRLVRRLRLHAHRTSHDGNVSFFLPMSFPRHT